MKTKRTKGNNEVRMGFGFNEYKLNSDNVEIEIGLERDKIKMSLRLWKKDQQLFMILQIS